MTMGGGATQEYLIVGGANFDDILTAITSVEEKLTTSLGPAVDTAVAKLNALNAVSFTDLTAKLDALATKIKTVGDAAATLGAGTGLGTSGVGGLSTAAQTLPLGAASITNGRANYTMDSMLAAGAIPSEWGTRIPQIQSELGFKDPLFSRISRAIQGGPAYLSNFAEQNLGLVHSGASQAAGLGADIVGSMNFLNPSTYLGGSNFAFRAAEKDAADLSVMAMTSGMGIPGSTMQALTGSFGPAHTEAYSGLASSLYGLQVQKQAEQDAMRSSMDADLANTIRLGALRNGNFDPALGGTMIGSPGASLGPKGIGPAGGGSAGSGAGGGGGGLPGPLGSLAKHFTWGLTAYPAFAAAGAVMTGISTGIQDMSTAGTADYNAAWAQGFKTPSGQVDMNSGTLQGEMSAISAISGQTGFKPADLTNTFTENYRLLLGVTGNAAAAAQGAVGMTRTGGLISNLTGKDPATVQGELSPILKAFGQKQVSQMPDMLAIASKTMDISPADLEMAVSRSAGIASAVGIGSKKDDLAYLMGFEGTLMQDMGLNATSAQSATRLFFSNLRSAGKEKTLMNMGFGDTMNMTGADALNELERVYTGQQTLHPSQRQSTNMRTALRNIDMSGVDHKVSAGSSEASALVGLEAISGSRSGMYLEDLLKHFDTFNAAVDKFAAASTTGSMASTYTQGRLTQTIAGQMDQLSTAWSRLWSNPNAAPTGALSAILATGTNALNMFNDAGTLHGITDPMTNNPYIEHNTSGFGGTYQSSDITAMYQDMVRKIKNPKTSAAERASLMATYNAVMQAKGDTQTYKSWSPAGQHALMGWGVPQDVPSQYRVAISKAAAVAGIDPSVLAAQLRQESGFHKNAVSPAGAEGIAQFMPDTAKQYGLKNPFDPIASIAAEGAYMHDLMAKDGSVERALSDYNSGHPDAYLNPSYGGGQTYNYVRAIMASSGTSNRISHMGGQHTILGDLIASHQVTQQFGNNELTRRPGWQMEQPGTVFPDQSAVWGRAKGGIYFQHLHTGEDLNMGAGTKLDSPWEGTVTKAGWDKTGYGNEVMVEDVNHKFSVLLAHLSKIDVKQGQHVQAGALLGLSGSTGNSTGDHLHLGVEDMASGHFIDPQQAAGYYLSNPNRGASSGGGAGGDFQIVSALNQLNQHAKNIADNTGASASTLNNALSLQQQAAGDIGRMANFNAPAGYMIPTYEMYASYSAAKHGAPGTPAAASGSAHQSVSTIFPASSGQRSAVFQQR